MAKKGIFKRFLAGVTAAVLALALTACGDDGSGQIFQYSVSGGMGTLDPQFAQDSTSQLIVANIFEGLLVETPEGELRPGVAQAYETSADGRVYTFHLRQDAAWSDGAPVTAQDFVFALQRLFGLQGVSPHAANLLAIEGAAEILAGEASPSALGVRAVDDHTLEIRLAYADASLPALMAAPYTMPCRRDFYNDQRGRYGVSYDTTLYNGPFVLAGAEDGLIRLRRNANYHSAEPAVAQGVNITLYREDLPARFAAGESDVLQLADPLPALPEGIALTSFEDTTWALCYNQQRSLLGEEEIRLALSAAVNRETVAANLDPHATPTQNLVPRAVNHKSRSYRAQAGGLRALSRTADEAEALFKEGLRQAGESKLPFTELLVPDTDAARRIAGGIQGDWQRTLHASINVMPLPLEELLARVEAGDYDIALLPITADGASAQALLARFADEESPTGWQDADYTAALSAAAAEQRADRAAAALRACEQQLVDRAVLLPLYATSTHYATAEGVQNLWIYPGSGTLYFKYATRS